MPWCEECAKYLTPNAMNHDGSCPKCNSAVTEAPKEATEGESAPWHFKLMVAAVVVYIGYRFVELF